VDAPPRPLLEDPVRVLVGVDGDARRRLAGFVDPRGVGRADVDPDADPAGQIADGDRRLLRLGDAVGEADPFGVLETVGEDADEEALRRLGRVPGGPERQPLVDSPIDVGELDLEQVNRRVQRQVAGSMRISARL